jgi:hypothetical protein
MVEVGEIGLGHEEWAMGLSGDQSGQVRWVRQLGLGWGGEPGIGEHGVNDESVLIGVLGDCEDSIDHLGVLSDGHHANVEQPADQLDVLRVRPEDTRSTVDLSGLRENESGRGCTVESSLLRRQEREKLDRMSSAEGTSFSWTVEEAAWVRRRVSCELVHLWTSDFLWTFGLCVDMSVYFRKCAATQLVTGYPPHKVRVTCILYCK